ncbi:MAG: DUF3515 domain-containing protein [Mycobacterium sp.]|nr:DUF3515 domain-containing protein [Mycobacterium sp.]
MQGDTDGPPRALLIAAVAVAVAGIVAVLAVAASHRTPDAPVAIAAVPAPQAESPECQALLTTLPDQLGDYRRAETAQPTPAGTAAWRNGGESVVMRCGLDRPAEFVVGAPIQMVDQVQWFQLQDNGSARSTWLCVDRPAYVALTLPAGSGPTPIQTMSEVIDRTMPAIPIRPGKP